MKILIASFLIAMVTSVDFFTLPVTKNNGTALNLETYRGKKLLLVTLASGSPYNNQLQSLQQLQDLYSDSLVVIGFPTNSYGNEPKDDTAIAAWMQSKGCSFLIAAKSNVMDGEGQHPVFQWLASKEKNGRVGMPVRGDFNKFLIDKKGMVSGFFMPLMDPMDSLMKKAILAPTY
jgi:glutathione peroxidase